MDTKYSYYINCLGCLSMYDGSYISGVAIYEIPNDPDPYLMLV